MEPQIEQELTKRERVELKREERKHLEEFTMKKRQFKKTLKWTSFLIIFGGIISLIVWFSIQSEKKRPGELFTNQGQKHIAVGATHIEYNSNPPTSGPHYATPANWGIYQDELLDENLVHNLEHGGIWISYTNIATSTIAQIEALAKLYPDKIIVTSRSRNDSKIALASWTRLLKLDQFDEKIIVDFIKTNKNRSPESNIQ